MVPQPCRNLMLIENANSAHSGSQTPRAPPAL